MTCIINFLQRKKGHSSQSIRRKIDILRDERISNLKFALNNNTISILDYCRALRNLYSLVNDKKKQKIKLLTKIINQKSLIKKNLMMKSIKLS
jgi:hypothetical protein